LGLLDFFKKKSEEEEFQEAVNHQDYVKIINLGRELLKKNPENLSVLNPFVDALVKMAKKDEAVRHLVSYAEKKLSDEYYDIAIPVLRKALRIDPTNLKTIKLLINAYKNKELYYDAFKLLVESLKKFKEARINPERIKSLIEKFIEEQSHPLFYEKYGDMLVEEGDRSTALINYMIAANFYEELNNHRAAFRSLTKARRIKRTRQIDEKTVKAVAHLEPKVAGPVVLDLLKTYTDPEFLETTVEAFKEAKALSFLKNLAQELKEPEVKNALLALVNYELGEVEASQEYLERLKLLNRETFTKVNNIIKSKGDYPTMILSLEGEEELPEPEQILEALTQSMDFEEVIDQIEVPETPVEEETPGEITAEINILKEIDRDGLRYTSKAEALLGLGKYDEAVEAARKALKTDQAAKAVLLIGEALRLKGDYREALSFLLDQLENPNLSEEDKARIKVLIGEIYEERGETNKAVYWLKEANKVLKDEELKEKIDELSTKRV